MVKKRVGKVAYELELPPQMSGVHPVFHVSMLRLAESKAGVRPTVDLSQIDLSDDISYEEQPIQILDRKVQQLRSKTIRRYSSNGGSTITRNSLGSGRITCEIDSRTVRSGRIIT
ncbi:hypothetical protein Scep_014684 [Stephania cephalantha]|uniref:Tf2-1-like SH3-like domain-containing protein n=1 Tax=Stephania cephalantha TaxID=152367 RepID=A0AAP0J3M4_9MAGN